MPASCSTWIGSRADPSIESNLQIPPVQPWETWLFLRLLALWREPAQRLGVGSGGLLCSCRVFTGGAAGKIGKASPRADSCPSVVLAAFVLPPDWRRCPWVSQGFPSSRSPVLRLFWPLAFCGQFSISPGSLSVMEDDTVIAARSGAAVRITQTTRLELNWLNCLISLT